MGVSNLSCTLARLGYITLRLRSATVGDAGITAMTTATEVLIDTMNSLQSSEATAILIVWTDENGNLNVRTSCVSSHAIGLARYAEAYLLNSILGGEI